ncbi:MAG: terminase family protein, partial [Candidatus Izemoplasmatales bacterium]
VDGQLSANTSFNISLLPYQSKLLFSNKPFLAFIAGTGAGKTYFAPIWFWYQSLRYPNEEWILSAPTIPMMKRTIIKYFQDFFDRENIIYHYNKADFIFELPHATIHCISAQEPDRMQGLHVKGIIGDECGLYDRLWWETAMQRISFKKGFILLTSTPYGFNWLKTDIYDAWLAGDKEIEFINPTSLDNPFYPREEFEKARNRLPEWKFKMLYEGKFMRPEGLIYPDYTTVEPFEVPDNWEYVLGLDFGWNDPTALSVLRINPETGEEFITEEYKKSKMTISELVALIERYPEGTQIEADPSDKQIIQTLKEDYNLNINSANNNVFGGIMCVQEKFKSGKTKIFNNLLFTLDELERYTWDIQKGTDEIKDRPKKRGQNIHLLDAIRYLSTRKSQYYKVRLI